MNRHKGLEWAKVQAKLGSNTKKLLSLKEMDITGGEPDVVAFDKMMHEYILTIFQMKAPRAVEIFVMTVTH